MILLLGRYEAIEEFIKRVRVNDKPVNSLTDIMRCPFMDTHHTDYEKFVRIAKIRKPFAVMTQNLEMIDVFLESHLDFKVVTVKYYENELKVAIRTKEDVLKCRKEFNFDPRN